VPAEADALANLEDGNIGADFVEDSSNFMTGYAWIGDAGKSAIFCDGVAVTNPACLHTNAHMAGTGRRELALYQFEWTTGRSDLKSTTFNTGHSFELLAVGCAKRFSVAFRFY
jgi:hypothetical protein